MDQDSQDKHEQESNIHKAMKLVSYPVAGAVAYMATKTSVRDAAYQRAKSRNAGVKELDEKHSARTTEILDQWDKREVTHMTHEQFSSQMKEAKNLHTEAVAAKLEHLDLHTMGKQWNFVKSASQQRALLDGMKAGGITIGALLTMANSKAIAHFFSRSNDESRER